MRILAATRLFAAAALVVAGLSGCSATVNLEAAPQANDPACAEIIVRLPDALADLGKRTTNAQSTAAWGEPASVILRCGLEPVEVSKLPCVTSSGIDWLVDDSDSPNYRFTTFGRKPATEVIVDSTKIAGVTALDGLASAVSKIVPFKQCTYLPD